MTLVSARDFSNYEIEALERGLQYWAEVVLPTGSPVTPVVIRAGVDPATNYNAGAYTIPGLNNGTPPYNIVAEGIDPGLFKSNVPNDTFPGFHSLMEFNNASWGFDLNTQLAEHMASYESVMIHEFGHAMGIAAGVTNWNKNLVGTTGNVHFVGTHAATVYGDGTLRAVPMYHSSSQESSHFGLLNGLMSHQGFRNFSGFMEVEMASLQDLGYVIDRRNFFGKSIYTDGNTIANMDGYFESKGLDASGNWLGYNVGIANKSSHGLGLHIYGSGNTVVQKADLLSSGEAGGGIRIDGFNNNVTIDKNTVVMADGERGTGLLVSFGTNHQIVHQGTLKADGNDGIAVRFDFGPGFLGRTAYSYGSILDLNNQTVSLNGALADSFDVSGSISGSKAAIYISPNAHVAEINFMQGAVVDGDVISDYDDEGDRYFYPHPTEMTFGKTADANGQATAAADASFDFTINGKLWGSDNPDTTQAYNGRGIINIHLVGGKTTVSENADVNVVDLKMDAATTLVLESDVNLAGDFEMENATIGFNTATDPTLIVAQDAKLSGNNTLDITQFSNGTYTIVTADTFSDKDQFDTLTIGGKAKKNRHHVTWTQQTPGKDISVTLAAQNIHSTWIGGNGIWDASSENWLSPSSEQEIFIGGDAVMFNTGEGTVNVAAAANPADMTLTNGANYLFTGDNIHVAKGSSTIATATGALTVDNAAEARFTQNVSAQQLKVDNALIGIEQNVTVSGNADFTNANLEIKTTENSAAQFDIAGTATVDGGEVSFTGTQRRGIKYDFLTAGTLDVVDEFALGTLSSGLGGALEYVVGTDGVYSLQMAEQAVVFAGIAETRNQKRFGGYLDGISESVPFSDMNDILGILDDLALGNPDAARYALDEMNGSIYATIGTAGVMNTSMTNYALAGFLRQEEFRAGGCDPCGAAGRSKKSRHLWATAYGMGGSTRFDGNAYGYDQSFGGTLFGVDRQFSRRTRLGFYGSYGEGRVSTNGLVEKSKSHELMLGAYLRREMKIGYALLSGGVGTNRYDTDRTLTSFGRQTGNKHDAFTGTVYAERGAELKNNYMKLTPYVALQYVGIQQERFKEKGAASLNIYGKTGTTDSLRSFLGSRIESNSRKIKSGHFAVNASVAWMHEFLSDTAASFKGGLAGSPDSTAKFSVLGNNPNRDWAIIGIGSTYDRSRVRFFGGYDIYANSNQVLHTGNVAVAREKWTVE